MLQRICPVSTGNNGFRLDGVLGGSYSSFSVNRAGNINGNEFDDVIAGVSGTDPNGSISGSSYVIFGRAAAKSIKCIFKVRLEMIILLAPKLQSASVAKQAMAGWSVEAMQIRLMVVPVTITFAYRVVISSLSTVVQVPIL